MAGTILARVVREGPRLGLKLLRAAKLSLDSCPLHTWFPPPRMLIPRLFACLSVESPLERLSFQEAFSDPYPLAGPGGPAIGLRVPCVIRCGSAEQEVVGLLAGGTRKPLIQLGFEG